MTAVTIWYIEQDSFNPAEAEDGFRRTYFLNNYLTINCFNPAEAEDGFRRRFVGREKYEYEVSIQPKPKTGLEGIPSRVGYSCDGVSIQPKPKTGLEVSS